MRIDAYGPSLTSFTNSKAAPRLQPVAQENAKSAAPESASNPSPLSAQEKFRELLDEKRLTSLQAFDEEHSAAVLGAHIDLRV
jgi:hypothetical protein